VTSKKQLKLRVRARMAKTGESYTSALHHLAGADAGGGAYVTTPGPVLDHGYRLRGGLHPETANIANLLAHHGITAGGRPVSEAMVFGIGGGPGAGYILWQFKRHGSAHLTLFFRHRSHYPDRWTTTVLDRLGVRYRAHHTGGAKGAAARLSAELAAGRPCVIRPDRYHIGYWRLPDSLDGYGGHDVVAIAEDADGVHLDDRNLTPLTVPRERVDRARGRVGSYRNSLYVIEPPANGQAEIPLDALRAAVRAGLAECVENLGGTSDSFALPAWRKWARLMTDTRNAKAWPKAFADRTGLAGALLSTWEGVMPMGMTGGHLRGLTADFLDEAAELLAGAGGGAGRPGTGGVANGVADGVADALPEVAAGFRTAAASWERVAAAALPDDVPELVRLRELTSAVSEGVADPASATDGGDGGDGDGIAGDARRLWELRRRLDRDFPLDDAAVAELFSALGEAVHQAYADESAAMERLRTALAGSG
jgi:hypothetical protein